MPGNADQFPAKGSDEDRLRMISEDLENGKFIDDKNDPIKGGSDFLMNAIADAPVAIAGITANELAGEYSEPRDRADREFEKFDRRMGKSMVKETGPSESPVSTTPIRTWTQVPIILSL